MGVSLHSFFYQVLKCLHKRSCGLRRRLGTSIRFESVLLCCESLNATWLGEAVAYAPYNISALASALEVGSTYHINRRNREGAGRSLRSCRSDRRSSAQRQETRRRCNTYHSTSLCATLRSACANEYAPFRLCRALSSLQIRAGQTTTASARARQHLQSHKHANAATRRLQTYTRALCHGEETAPELSCCHTNEPQACPRHETGHFSRCTAALGISVGTLL